MINKNVKYKKRCPCLFRLFWIYKINEMNMLFESFRLLASSATRRWLGFYFYRFDVNFSHSAGK